MRQISHFPGSERGTREFGTTDDQGRVHRAADRQTGNTRPDLGNRNRTDPETSPDSARRSMQLLGARRDPTRPSSVAGWSLRPLAAPSLLKSSPVLLSGVSMRSKRHGSLAPGPAR